MQEINKIEEIKKTLLLKSSQKQDVFAQTKKAFIILKEVLKNLCEVLNKEIGKQDKRIKIEYEEINDYLVKFRFAGDVLYFYMHSNVFAFDEKHRIWQTKYVQEDNFRSFNGIIHIYNFLNDSFLYNRLNDLGYLVGRIFVNKELHFFVESNQELKKRFSDLSKNKFTKELIYEMIQELVLGTLNFDLLTPPYNVIQTITVNDVNELTNNIKIQTGKRLGFKMSSNQEIY